jgi:hypothetical protein
MKLYPVVVVFLSVLTFGCTTRYNIKIKTIPKGQYDIYVNKNKYGVITNSDTSFQTEEVSMFKPLLVEIKNNESYGYANLNNNDSSNVNYLNTYKIEYGSGKYTLTFIFNADYVPRPFTEIDLNPKNKSKVFKFNNGINSPKVAFCILGSDTNSYSYFGLKRHLDRYLESNNYSWRFANTNIQKVLNENALKASYDSLSSEIWKEASNQSIKYLIMFYGYSINGSKGVAPSDVAASAAISSFGVLAGSLTGLYIFATPNGQSQITKPTIFCAIYSVNPNRCILKAKEAITSYNDDNIKSQVNIVLTNLFNKIDILINK